MLAYLLDWLGLLLRWLHIVAGIAWIGASFYFVWLDNHLQAPGAGERVDPGVAGELWAVHGGGFYRAQKYRLAPDTLPPTLHWFYWEAYSTWLSGFALLCLLYFLRAEGYLIDPAVAMLSKPMAIGIALGFLIGSWLVYDGLCRSPLGRRAWALGAVLGTALCAEAWALCQLFSGRGAFMVFGSALGSIMVANVLFVIIPGQRELVHAKQQGRALNPVPGLRARKRSVHNTYFTLPVLFVMLSNHYAMTYGARYNWLVLIALSFAGACIRAWFVARHRAAERSGHVPVLPALLAAAALAAVVIALAPASGAKLAAMPAAATADEASRMQQIVQLRCAPCHALHPTLAGFGAAPNGVVLETLDQLTAQLVPVQQQLSARAMPLGNLTVMTEDERTQMLTWIGQRAPR
jgi:uncharacterized membrane protein